MSSSPILRRTISLAVLLVLPWSGTLVAQSLDAASWTATLWNNYRIVPNVTYGTFNTSDAKVDLYLPRNITAPVPTVLHIHGGGWIGGTKETDMPLFLPYLEMGWAVVNVEYRLGRVSLAPAAVEDCRCALRWVYKNATEYKFDTTRIVVTGFSAGGHLSLTTGMIPVSAGLDRQCTSSLLEIPVAAVVNWYGITDVVDLLSGEDMKDYAVRWFGSLPDREAVARRVSPLSYVRKGLPPILTIHGDADPIVPYSHATRLHEALERIGSPNQLLTIPMGKHGGFTPEEMRKIYSTIMQFLHDQGFTRRGM
jgi:acetyl esterase/lipase